LDRPESAGPGTSIRVEVPPASLDLKDSNAYRDCQREKATAYCVRLIHNALSEMNSQVAKSVVAGLSAVIIHCTVVRGEEYEFQWVNGNSPALAPEGVVWLYHYGWGALQRFKLGNIHKGRARIELSAKFLEQNVRPAPNTKAYLVVLEFPAKRWYRSADIEPSNLLRDFLPALDSLGTLQKSNSKSVRKLVLPAPAKRRFRFLSSEGAPLVRKSIPVSIYVSDYNHNAVHEGLPLGTFTTDDKGWLDVPAPKLPLYVNLTYWVPDGRGFAGQMYALQDGMKMDPSAKVIRLRWSLPGETWELWLRTREGKPIPNASLVEWIRIMKSGANWGQLGVTDAKGLVRVVVEPQSIERMAFQIGTETRRDLSAEELGTLWRKKKLTITWEDERH
jgi:hypothetical protein